MVVASKCSSSSVRGLCFIREAKSDVHRREKDRAVQSQLTVFQFDPLFIIFIHLYAKMRRENFRMETRFVVVWCHANLAGNDIYSVASFLPKTPSSNCGFGEIEIEAFTNKHSMK